MVGSDKKNKEMSSKIQKSKMEDEGGMGVEADYNYDVETEQKKPTTDLRKSEMVDEGGLGAALYYDKDEMVVDADVAEGKVSPDEVKNTEDDGSS